LQTGAQAAHRAGVLQSSPGGAGAQARRPAAGRLIPRFKIFLANIRASGYSVLVRCLQRIARPHEPRVDQHATGPVDGCDGRGSTSSPASPFIQCCARRIEMFNESPLCECGHDNRTFPQRCADAVTHFCGSWHFVIWSTVLVVAWITVNAWWLVFGRE